MKQELFEFFRREKINLDTLANFILTMDEVDLVEFCKLGNTLVSYSGDDIAVGIPSQFKFVASNNLAGDRSTCTALSCRVERARNLGRFASLYADKVLVKNPFESWAELEKISFDERYDLVSDLAVVLVNEKLFSEGILDFKRLDHHFCQTCLNRVLEKEKQLDKRNRKAVEFYADSILERTSYRIKNKDDVTYIEIEGDEEIVEHGRSVIQFRYYVDDVFKPYVNSGKTLPKKLLRRTGLLHRHVGILYEDFMMQDWYANNFRYNYLSGRKIDVEMISKFREDTKSVQSMIPLPLSSKPDNLLKLRKQDGLAFANFRRSSAPY